MHREKEEGGEAEPPPVTHVMAGFSHVFRHL